MVVNLVKLSSQKNAPGYIALNSQSN